MRKSRVRLCALSMSAVLLVAAVLGALGSPPNALAAGTVYVSVNYDESAIPKDTNLYNGSVYNGSVGGGWGIYNSAADTDYVRIEQAPGREDYALELVANTKNLNTGRNNLGGTATGNTGITGKLVFEADVYMNDAEHKREVQFRSLNDPYPATATTNVGAIVFDNAGGIRNAEGGAIGSYEANEWYHLKLFVDNAARTVSYFVNDAYLGEASLPSAWQNVRHIYLNESYKTGAEGRWYVDDLTLSAYTAVTGISVSPEELELQETQSVNLSATALPEGASDPRISWSVDDPSVATVTDGVVHALRAGSASVTAVTYEGAYSQTVPVRVIEPVALQSIELPAALTLAETASQTLEPAFVPDNALDRELVWSSSDPSVASVDANGSVTGIAPGTAAITATSASDGSIAAATQVTVVAYVPVTGIALANAPAQMAKYDTLRLEATVTPADATDPTLTWQSDNPSVLSVGSGGELEAREVGTATITAGSANGVTAAATVQVVPAEPDDPLEYDKLRIRWKETLTGTDRLDVADEGVQATIEATAAEARTYRDGLRLDGAVDTLWADLPASASDSTFILTHYARLKTMALAYATRGTELYGDPELRDDIVGALDWLLGHLYTDDGAEFGNWWNWEIGVPNRLADILILMYDDLTERQITDNAASIDHYIGDISSPSFTQTGANRSDIMLIETRLGLAEKNYDRLIDARNGLTPLFDYATSGDGFYEDGSYVQHGTIAYTGSYGEVLIQGMGNLLLLLNGSTWQPVVPGLGNVYRWIADGYAPILYKGQALDMTRGRAIVRGAASDAYYSARNILIGISRIAQTAPAEEAAGLKSFVKYHFHYQLERGDAYGGLPLDLRDTIREWMEDPAIEPAAQLPEHVELNAMARSVHRGKDYLFGVSKSSKRIATYELTNGENPKGWYTGDGMTYLYNGDLAQYTDGFWETIDWNRLPGTTVVARTRYADQYQYGDGETTPTNAWAGGAELGRYGVSGMNLRQIGTQMTANKSWFAFDDEIVALGSGITSADDLPVETIVEQRKLKDDDSNKLYINGTLKAGPFAEETVAAPRWVHLQGNAKGADVGYVFPGDQPLEVERKAQEGRTSDIRLSNPPSSTEPTELLSRNYLTMWFGHGVNPTNGTYEYAILPNASKRKTEAYAASPDYTVLANTPEAQAVRENTLGVAEYNFWANEATTAGGVTSSGQASVIVRSDPATGTLEVAVADPTLEKDGAIEIELNQAATGVIARDSGIEVLQLEPTVKLRADVKNTLGRSLGVTLQTEPQGNASGNKNGNHGNKGNNGDHGNNGNGNKNGNNGSGSVSDGNDGRGRFRDNAF